MVSIRLMSAHFLSFLRGLGFRVSGFLSCRCWWGFPHDAYGSYGLGQVSVRRTKPLSIVRSLRPGYPLNEGGFKRKAAS